MHIIVLLAPTRVYSQSDEVSDDVEVEVDDADDSILDDEDEEIEEEEILEEPEVFERGKPLSPHPGVTTTFLFPNNDEYKFVQGEEVVLLVGVHNGAMNNYFNVSYVGAHLHSPYDFTYYIHNFTIREQEALLGPGGETTIEYRFRPDPSLEPLEFTFSAWVVYNSSQGKLYQNQVVNTTIELIEKAEPWSVTYVASSLFTFGVLAASAAGAAWIAGYDVLGYVQNIIAGQTKKRKSHRSTSSKSSSSGDAASSDEIASGWETVAYTPAAKSKAVKKKGSKKPPSKKSNSKKSDSKKGSKKTDSEVSDASSPSTPRK